MAKDDNFGYVRRTVKQFNAKMSERSGGFDDFLKREFKRYKPRDGKNLIRILQPTWDDPDHYAYELFVNYSIGPDKASYLSLSKHGKGHDPLAEARIAAQDSKDEKLAIALSPKQRWAVWLIDRMAEDEGPMFWAMPKTFNKDLMSAARDEDTGEVVWIDDPKEGCDVRFYKEGTGLTTEYPGAKIKIQQPSPVSADPAQMREWVEFIKDNPIPDCLQWYDYDHISRVFNGAGGALVADDDEPVRPVAKAKPKPALADDMDDEVPWQEVKPKRPNATTQAALDELEDDDDVAPPTKAKAKVKEPAPEDEEAEGGIRERLRRRRERLAAGED